MSCVPRALFVDSPARSHPSGESRRSAYETFPSTRLVFLVSTRFMEKQMLRGTPGSLRLMELMRIEGWMKVSSPIFPQRTNGTHALMEEDVGPACIPRLG
ncbi:hypothetical protein D9758_006150 [Tetrapyrgos nigripes]|uniref:Uncharacterized protein n=1 Tax=Tetrapyrgos nigripes TaxID=182062 RepID=A0A8H5GAT8_9AGAR|nr:hypothetical protein D9758_006150 [Tetrapyrgos nigripes]